MANGERDMASSACCLHVAAALYTDNLTPSACMLYDVAGDCGHDTANLRTDDRKKGPDGDGDGNGSGTTAI